MKADPATVISSIFTTSLTMLYIAWLTVSASDDYILINADPDHWASRDSTTSGWYFQAGFSITPILQLPGYIEGIEIRDGGAILGPVPFGAGMLVRGDQTNFMKVGRYRIHYKQ